MNTFPLAVLILGKYGAGKSLFSQILNAELNKIFPNLTLIEDGDRQDLNTRVIDDVNAWGAPEKGRRGVHATIEEYAPNGDPVFSVHDGVLHAQAQHALIERIKTTPDGALRVIELAVGPNVVITEGREPLRQSGAYILNLLQSHRVDKYILAIEIEAGFHVRDTRNRERPIPVPQAIFNIAATDDGEFWNINHGLGARYLRIYNESNDPTVLEVGARNLVSWLQTAEGAPTGSECRFNYCRSPEERR